MSAFPLGDRVAVGVDSAGELAAAAGAFAVYQRDALALAVGDAVRVTANGKSRDGHRLNNGAVYTVAGFTDRGDIKLDNGWVVDQAFGHISHAYTATSFAAQGRTVDRVLLAANAQTLPAMSQATGYVAVSRGREAVTVYTEDKRALLEAASREDRRMLATDLVRKPHTSLKQRLKKRVAALRRIGQVAKHYARELIHGKQHEQGFSHER